MFDAPDMSLDNTGVFSGCEAINVTACSAYSQDRLKINVASFRLNTILRPFYLNIGFAFTIVKLFYANNGTMKRIF